MQSCSHPREDNPGYCDSPEQITPNKTCTLTHTRMCTHTQICAQRCTRSQGPRQTYWGGDVGCGGEPWPQLRHHYLMATLPTRLPARARAHAHTHFGTRYVAGTRTHTHTARKQEVNNSLGCCRLCSDGAESWTICRGVGGEATLRLSLLVLISTATNWDGSSGFSLYFCSCSQHKQE